MGGTGYTERDLLLLVDEMSDESKAKQMLQIIRADLSVAKTSVTCSLEHEMHSRDVVDVDVDSLYSLIVISFPRHDIASKESGHHR